MFVNLTPHAIVVRQGETDLVIEPSGKVARLRVIEIDAEPVLGVPSISRYNDSVDMGIACPVEGEMYIVSSMVFDAVATKPCWFDCVVAPDTGKTAIRNDKGHIVAVTRFVRHQQ